MLRGINLLKIISVLVFLLSLVLVYAYAPVKMLLTPDASGLMLDREDFFYFCLAIFVVINIALMVLQSIIEPQIKSEDIKAWLRGLTFVLNLYFAFMIAFVGVINNQGHLSATGFSYLNYIGPVLIFSWIIGLFYLRYKKA